MLIQVPDLATFKSYPYLRKPMSGAFNIAWSVLKALPEQQGFFEARSPFRPRTYGDAPINPVQYRTGTIHPAILRLMRENQGKVEGFNPRGSVSTDTRIRQPDEFVGNRGYLQDPYDEFGQRLKETGLTPEESEYFDSEESEERRAFEEMARFDPAGFREMYGVDSAGYESVTNDEMRSFKERWMNDEI